MIRSVRGVGFVLNATALLFWAVAREAVGARVIPQVRPVPAETAELNVVGMLLEPTFSPDREAFSRCRAEQRALLERKIDGVDSIKLFGFGSRFHEVLAKCSGNPLFYDAVQRVNRLRRLLEYRVMNDMHPFRNEAREHLEMLDLVEAGKMHAASKMMARHLDRNRHVKLKILNVGTSRATKQSPLKLSIHF